MNCRSCSSYSKRTGGGGDSASGAEPQHHAEPLGTAGAGGMKQCGGSFWFRAEVTEGVGEVCALWLAVKIIIIQAANGDGLVQRCQSLTYIELFDSLNNS